jgi:phosphatidylinositol 3-kinase
MSGDPIKIVDKLYERFYMSLSSEEAEKCFLGLITESVNALMPQIMEKIHVWANYWKRI